MSAIRVICLWIAIALFELKRGDIIIIALLILLLCK